MTSKERALAYAAAAADKKALDITVLDLRGAGAFTDFFVIASGSSGRHAHAVADAVLERAHRMGDRALGVEGMETERWILVDLGDVVVHVFKEDAREFYGLERLWGEAAPVDVPLAAGAR